MSVVFVYPNSRTALLERVARGEVPDTPLLGQNHLRSFGIETTIHDPSLRRRQRRSGLRHRITWNVREVTLPWELGDAELACTPLARVFPLTARVRRRPRVLLISYHLCSTYERSAAWARRMLVASVRSAAGVVCVSAAGSQRLIDLTGVEESRVHVAELGVDERFWSPAPPAADGYVLSVGRDLARDYGTFLQALADLPRRVVLVAKEENLAGLDVPRNVEVKLDIAPAEVRDLYAGAACVVVPIHPEGHPAGTENSGTIALLEAMAVQRPAIVTDRPTLRDYVRPGETALVVPPRDPTALREAVARVLDDDTFAGVLARAARQSVEDRFTTRHLAGRLARVIEGLEPTLLERRPVAQTPPTARA
jgi:glycosyltransferase involved in cell wall biosynthesis